MATYGPRGNLGVKDHLRRTSELTKPPAEPGIPVSTWTRRTLEKASNNNTRVNKSTTSRSPVVLVAGPGPDGKPVNKPPEGKLDYN